MKITNTKELNKYYNKEIAKLFTYQTTEELMNIVNNIERVKKELIK